MEHAKRMILVDPTTTKLQSEAVSGRFVTPYKKELEGVDKDIKTVLNDTSISATEKVKRYNEVLMKYQSMKENETSSKTVEKKESKTLDPLLSISQQYKNRGKALLDYLSSVDGVKWNDRGEITINNKRVPNSNIADLISYAVRPGKKKNPPIAWSEFKDGLLDSNAPQSLLGQPLRTPSIQQTPVIVQKTTPIRTRRGSRLPKPITPHGRPVNPWIKY